MAAGRLRGTTAECEAIYLHDVSHYSAQKRAQFRRLPLLLCLLSVTWPPSSTTQWIGECVEWKNDMIIDSEEVHAATDEGGELEETRPRSSDARQCSRVMAGAVVGEWQSGVPATERIDMRSVRVHRSCLRLGSWAFLFCILKIDLAAKPTVPASL